VAVNSTWSDPDGIDDSLATMGFWNGQPIFADWDDPLTTGLASLCIALLILAEAIPVPTQQTEIRASAMDRHKYP
jgi:hypothetical protein